MPFKNTNKVKPFSGNIIRKLWIYTPSVKELLKSILQGEDNRT